MEFLGLMTQGCDWGRPWGIGPAFYGAIERARRMLAESDQGILPIALACGFNTPEHFYRTFRKLVGVTPSTYRRAERV